MPLYYFYLVGDGSTGDLLLNPGGREFRCGDEVARAALDEARAVMSHDILYGRLILDQDIVVQDAGGQPVHRLPFAEAIQIHWSEAITEPAAWRRSLG